MVPLRAYFALRLDAVGPVHDHRVARAAIVRGDLLGPLERRVGGHGPARLEVRVGQGTAPLIQVRQLILDRVWKTIKHDQLVSLNVPVSPPSALEPLSPKM